MQDSFIKRPPIRIALAVVSFAAAAAVLIGARLHDAAGRELREAILAELQPSEGEPPLAYVSDLTRSPGSWGP